MLILKVKSQRPRDKNHTTRSCTAWGKTDQYWGPRGQPDTSSGGSQGLEQACAGGLAGCPPPCCPPAVSSPLLFNCLETELTAVGTAQPLLVS